MWCQDMSGIFYIYIYKYQLMNKRDIMPLSQKTWFGNSFKNYYFFNLLRTAEVNLAENMLWIKGVIHVWRFGWKSYLLIRQDFFLTTQCHIVFWQEKNSIINIFLVKCAYTFVSYLAVKFWKILCSGLINRLTDQKILYIHSYQWE